MGNSNNHEEPTSNVEVETVQEQEVKKESTYFDPSTDVAPVVIDENKIEAVIMPAGLYKQTHDTIRKLGELDDSFAKDFTDLESLSTGVNVDSLRMIVKNDGLVNAFLKENTEWVQNPIYADKALSIRELSVGNGKNLKGDAAVAKFYSYLGMGGIIQIPLWHSGFWISLKTIKETDLLNLEMMIADSQIRLGRETNTLIYSNHSVIFNRLVLEFIVRHLQSASIELKNPNELLKYVKIQDLYPIVLGLIQSMYLKGYSSVRTCVNSLELDAVDGSPKCDYTITSTMDPKKLLWVDRSALTSEHFKIMSKRSPNSVTTDEILEYQATLDVNKKKTVSIPTESGHNIVITLNGCSLADHVDNGERWVNDVISVTEKLFTEKLSADEKNQRVELSSKMVLLGTYNHLIESIQMPESTDVIIDKKTIESILEIIVTDKKGYNALFKEIRTYIDGNTIAVVGIPNYRCPKCKELQTDSGAGVNFKEIIPLNITESFFDLCTLKTDKIATRTLED